MKMISRLFVILSLTILILPMTFAQEGENSTQVIGGDEDQLRKMLARYVGGLGFGPGMPETTIYVGSLPETMPVRVPVPESVSIIGSVVRDEAFMDAQYTEIHLETESSPNNVMEEMARLLGEEGWKAIDPQMNGPQPGGFVDMMLSATSFCAADNSASVNFNPFPAQPGQPTALMINVQVPADTYMCNRSADGEEIRIPVEPMMMDPFFNLPTLITPDGATLISANIGSGGPMMMMSSRQSIVASGTFQTEMTTAELHAEYEGQITNGEWEFQSQLAGDGLISSKWAVEREEFKWAMTFTVIEGALDGEISTILLLEQTP